jgi:hypothetical protein
MEITGDQRDAWSQRKENGDWERVIGPLYKRNGTVDIEALHDIALLNGIYDTRTKYGSLNAGQIAMNIRNRLRPLWKSKRLKLPS